MLVLLLACRSGVIHYPTGNDDLRSAWFQTDDNREDAYAGLTETVVLLSNTEIDCDGIPSLTADKSSIDSPAEAAILTRENARIVVLFLFQRENAASLVGDYVLESEHTGKNVTTSNGVASAAYLGVNEAVLMDEDGLNRFYLPGSNPGDCELVVEVPSPGEVAITGDRNHLEGTFALDAIDVSGRFDAKECSHSTNPEFMNTLQAVVLLRDNLSMCVDEPTDTPSGG